MGNVMRRLYHRLNQLSPEVRLYLIGASMAFDLLPDGDRRTFEADDCSAMKKDWSAVANDMWYALDRARE